MTSAFPPWPFDKVERHLAESSGRRTCVLLSTGALNPVHLGHVAMFDKAKAGLSAEFGVDVVGGFLSPSHDLYLAGKYGDASFSAARRLEFCVAATRDHPVVAVGAWESGVDGRWPDFPEVTRELADALRCRFGVRAPEVLYLCGSDHFAIAGAAGLPGICVVSRGGRVATSDPARNIFAVNGTDEASPFSDLSATLVRAALRGGDMATLGAALHPDVLTLLTG